MSYYPPPNNGYGGSPFGAPPPGAGGGFNQGYGGGGFNQQMGGPPPNNGWGGPQQGYGQPPMQNQPYGAPQPYGNPAPYGNQQSFGPPQGQQGYGGMGGPGFGAPGPMGNQGYGAPGPMGGMGGPMGGPMGGGMDGGMGYQPYQPPPVGPGAMGYSSQMKHSNMQGRMSANQPPPVSYNGPTTGRKKALICACNYRGTPSALKGCISDAECIQYLLTSRLGFQQHDITVLRDDNPSMMPTRANMLHHMSMLTGTSQPGDSLFFHFSGHGSQTQDKTGDEADGLSETICPCDYKQAGQIVDDELNAILVNPLVQGVRLHCVIDACHSGSVMDLEYRCKVKQVGLNWKNEYVNRPRVYKGTRGGEVIQIGAARDKQVAQDTNALSGVSGGAATFSFIKAIESHGGGLSYGQLLMSMNATLEGATGGKQMWKGGFLGSVMGGKLSDMISSGVDSLGIAPGSQQPVLSSNHPFDLNRPFHV